MLPDSPSLRNATRLASIASLAVVIAVACQYTGSHPNLQIPSRPPSTALGPTISPTVTGPTIPADADAGKVEQARQLLDRWDTMLSDSSPNSFQFTNGLVGGGGWGGDNGGDLKVAFYAGLVEAPEPLSTDVPMSDAIEWADGTKQSVELISATDALAGLIANAEDPGACDKCAPIQVTGAHLTTVSTSTSRGEATVPAWQFEFVPDQTPIDPITFVAVKDAKAGTGEDTGGYQGTRIDAAYGNAQSTQITVSFTGSPWIASNPCGADYSATAVESDRAVAVIITELPSSVPFPTPAGAPYACPAMGFTRTATVDLSKALGNRTLLDVNYAVPVPLKNGPPPTFSPLP